MNEVMLYRLHGRFEDREGVSWFDTGMRAPDGRRVYSDGGDIAVRASVLAPSAAQTAAVAS